MGLESAGIQAQMTSDVESVSILYVVDHKHYLKIGLSLSLWLVVQRCMKS